MAHNNIFANGRMSLSSISKLRTKLRNGELSAAKILSESHEKISAIRPLNAFITELDSAETSRSLAETSLSVASSASTVKSLYGVPFAVKDNYCTKGVRTTCGSKMLENFVPTYTATVVQRLLDAGGVLMGKTNMDEFAMGSGSVDSVFGPVKNPWNDLCIAGGSSGGSAVTVATSCVAFALGSDTGGSVRNPASYCGIIGFKPSYGNLSRHGLISLLNSTDVPSIFAKTVEDARTVFQIIAGWDAKDSTTFTTPLPDQKNAEMRNLRVGIVKEFILSELGECLNVYKDVAQRLEEMGADVKEVSLPHSEYANACYTVLCACDVASNMARYDGVEFGHRSSDANNGTDSLYAATRHQGFNEVVRGRILAGNFFLLKRNYQEFFLQAAKVRRLIAEDFRRVFAADVDVILAPVTFAEAPKLEDFRKMDNRTQQEVQDLFTVGASLAGLPAITLPVAWSKNKMPLGIQLIAPFRQDLFLLDLAESLQTVTSAQKNGALQEKYRLV